MTAPFTAWLQEDPGCCGEYEADAAASAAEQLLDDLDAPDAGERDHILVLVQQGEDGPELEFEFATELFGCQMRWRRL